MQQQVEDLKQRLDEANSLLSFHEDRTHSLSQMLNLGIWEWDERADKPIFVSDEMAGIFGVDKERIHEIFRTGKDFESHIHPDDLEHYRRHLDSSVHLAEGNQHVFGYRIIRGKGEVRYLREYEQGVFDEDGRLVTSFGVVQDITESQLALSALRDSEERYSSLFAQMPLGVQEEDYSAIKRVVDKLQFQGVEDLQGYFLDNPKILREMVGQTRITNVNEALIRMHDAESREEFLEVEADVEQWWDAQWIEYYAAEIAALASDKKYYEAERVDEKVDGSYFETRSIVTLVRGFEDTWERVVTIHEDITERKRAEAELIAAKNLAEEASNAKSEFLSSMSHELRTPLNAIMGFSQLFAYDQTLGEQHLANATEINRAGKHLMSLIDQILDLSRIEAGEIGVSLEPVSLDQVLADSVNWVSPLAVNRQIDIDCDTEAFEQIHVLADQIRLKQVFLNLLTNAIKYNQQAGRVEIILDTDSSERVRIGVRDSGAGISPEKLEKLFQPFNRLGAEYSMVEGTGIGLVITRQLIDLMQGRLEVDSEPGRGSTFWVSLEAARMPEVAESSVAGARNGEESEATDISLSRILVAEDNLINQELMAAQLSILGYRADYAENGQSALARWQEGSYDLLLTDIRMPEMNGYDLVREIRQLEQGGETRSAVIAITANALEADVKQCFDVGVDHVISKPVELEDLRCALEKWTPQVQAELPREDDQTAIDLPTGDDPVDLAVLAQSTGNKVELHQQLLHSYLQALPGAIAEIRQAFAWKSEEKIAEYTHKLKSSSRSMGAMTLAFTCEALEKAARESDWNEIEKLVPRLERISGQVEQFLAAYLEATEQDADDAIDIAEAAMQVACDSEDITQFSIKLLLVDDDYIMHRVTTVMLNDLGVSGVMNAMSGSEALDYLERESGDIDVIICDLNMPGMDGVELIRHLAGKDYGGALILTSGEDIRILKTVEKLAIEHELQVLGVLEKPVSPVKLSELLDSLDQIRSEGTMMLVDAFGIDELERAIEEDQLDTFFQPKIDIESGQVVGVEALARWNHPAMGLIRPNSFITMAEENNLIGALTDNICQKALDYATRLRSEGFDLNVAINLSVDSLTDLEWPDRITEQLDQSGLDASGISFEITESRLMEHISVALDILSRLSLKRFKLSIDDFGTGYSSMEQLQRIPFSEFKIDRAFVHGAAQESSARAILESSVLLAKKLDMKVVAEGVEDQQDWDLVAQVGCDQVQGYFISRPLPFEQLLKWLRDNPVVGKN